MESFRMKERRIIRINTECLLETGGLCPESEISFINQNILKKMKKSVVLD